MKVTISERIQLHKLGYSREDIDAMINEPEQAPITEAAPVPAPDIAPAVQQNDPAILNALQDIKTQLQQMAVMNSSVPVLDTKESTFDILNNIINKGVKT